MHSLSKYVKLFARQGEYFVYSSLTNSFAQIDHVVYEAINNGLFHKLSEDEIHTFTRMKVIDVDDELELQKIKYNILTRRFNPHKIFLTINPTLSCNFACSYCFEGKLPSQNMSDVIEDAIVEFVGKRELVKLIDVVWFGGEPLLEFNRIETLTRKLQGLGKDYKAGMVSNGYLMTPEKVRKFKDLNIRSVQLTIDGSSATHNKRRPLRNGKPTFDVILENIRNATEIDPELSIIVRVNIDQNNQAEYDEVVNLLRTSTYRNVKIYPGFVVDLSTNQSGCVFDDDRVAAFLINQFYEHKRYSRFFYPSMNIGACAVRNPNSFVIGPSGELYKCWNDVGRADKIIGNINGTIANEKVLYQYLMKADPLFDKECDDCPFMPVCNGGCPYHRIKNEINGLKFESCSLFKKNCEEFLIAHMKFKTSES